MSRLLWWAFFAHVLAFIVMHACVDDIGRIAIDNGLPKTGFEAVHDRAMAKTRSRVEQLNLNDVMRAAARS